VISNLMFELRYMIGNTPWDTGVSPPELIAYLEENPPGRALDLGCGTGTNAITIHSYGWDVIGVDSSHFAIRRALEKTICEAREVEFRRLDVSRLKGIRGPFELILDIGCFHSLSPKARARYVQRLPQLIHPGGTYLLYSWLADPEESGDLPPSEDEIEQAFSPHFPSIKKELGTERERTSAWFWMHPKTT
jgi:cyclopropane fatty-acyl-phospholipid synthase-like methyltransferase